MAPGLFPTCLAVLLATGAHLFGLGQGFDDRLNDAFVRVAPNAVPEVARDIPDVAVVTIDPRSLRASPPWPWKRSVHADAVARLTDVGAQAIAFDIDFSSPSTPEEDRHFAAALRKSDRVVLATFSQTQQLEAGAELEIVNRPVPVLAEAARALGSVLVPIDQDGVVRHAPRTSPIGAEDIPSLARASLQIAGPTHLMSRIENDTEHDGSTLVDFRRAFPPIPTVAYIDLIENRFDPEKLRGRTVFIGATAAEFQDLWSTPAAPALPGVMIQAIGYRTAAAEAVGDATLGSAPFPITFALFALIGFATRARSGARTATRAALVLGAGVALLPLAWASLWFASVTLPLTVAFVLLGAQYTFGIEALQRRIRARADAQASSLLALSQLGDVGAESGTTVEGSTDAGLRLALQLLGDVVQARGIALLRSSPNGQFTQERIEWRPQGAQNEELFLDETIAAASIRDRMAIEREDPLLSGAAVIYSPLVSNREPIGALVVFCQAGQPVDSIKSRTIATVSSQLALTAQNLQLIERLRETFESSIAAVASAVEARDGYTDQHCRRLAAFSSLMGTRVGMSENAIRAMELGALLHDVGKIGIPDAVLNKPGRLSNEERREMEKHPEIGAGIIAPVIGLEETTLHCVIHHHERFDGTGYPEGLAAEEIPLAARIVSIVDVWDALSTSRPYKKAFSQPEVRDLMMKGRGTQFDPDLVDLFFEILNEQGDEMLELIARSTGTGDVP